MRSPGVTATRYDMRVRIVDAAAHLLHQHGREAVTTRGVAEAAGVQAPTIYRIFGDKDGLLDAVAEHELARYVTGKARAEGSDDPISDLRAAWDNHIRFALGNPALFAYLVDPDRGARSPAAAAGQDVLRARVHRLAVAGRLRVPERRAVDLIHAAGTGAVLAVLATDVEDRDTHLPDAIYDAVVRMITQDGPAVATDGATAAAVTLRAALPALAMLSVGERTLMGEWLDRILAAEA